MEATQVVKATQQHFLPRFLVKGFAARVSGRDVYTYQFRRDLSLDTPTNIRNIGASRDFYGKGGPGSLDDQITNEEGGLSTLLDDLRLGPARYGRDATIAALVAHVIVRTRHIRRGVATGLPSYVMRLARTLSAPDRQAEIEEAVVRQIEADPKRREWFCKQPRPARRRLVREFAKDWRTQMASRIVAELEQLDPDEKAASAHNRVLQRGRHQLRRATQLEPLEWEVFEAIAGPLILGDVGPVGRFGRNTFEQLVAHTEPPDALFLPISNGLVLVGTRTTTPRPQRVDADAVNVQVAALSREFFVCSQRTRREERYVARLGSRAELLDAAAERDAVDRVLEGLRRGD